MNTSHFSAQDVERQLAGRVLALDRELAPMLFAQAAARMSGATPLHAVGGLPIGLSRRPQRSGNTSIVNLSGFIGTDLLNLFYGTHPDVLLQELRESVLDPETSHVLLIVDSPGGSVDLVEETGATIRRLREIKPITALARPHMCSAAYWLAAQATTVIATPSARVGSIGVFLMHVSFARLNERIGIDVTYIASDPKKVEANENQLLADDARARLQKDVDRVNDTFIEEVAAGRRYTPAVTRRISGRGLAFDTKDALKLGLIDGIATIDDVLAGRAGAMLKKNRVQPGGLDRLSDADFMMIHGV